ncbi:MAG: undecaprenyl-diphosphate phosphatase [Defluviitaleaceae bacterium]|nr:undecaprenyl-diphosphate phosphatase [Defluviitaleaceae bacterium]
MQGITEFLPISSSGHLIIVGRAVGVNYMPLGFELLTHLATLLAVIVVMRKTLFGLVRKPFQKMNLLIIVATLPTVVIFLIFRNVFESAFDGRWLAFCFLITAIVLFVSGMLGRKARGGMPGMRSLQMNKKQSTLAVGDAHRASRNDIKELSFLDATIIGIIQGTAGLPGISRSGVTIAGAKMLGQDQQTAANFSFLIAIPIIIGASIFQFVGVGLSADAFGVSVAAAAAGFLAAFITGFIAISLMLKLFSRISLDAFAIYLVVLALFVVLNDFVWFLF